MSGAIVRRGSWVRLTLVPALVFLLLALLFLIGLKGRDPSVVPSALLGKSVPEFTLPPLEGLGLPGLDSADLRTGKVTLVNVWASWCGPCRFEFPALQKLSAAYGKKVAFLGVDKQDSNDAAKTFLGEEPVPYPSYSDPHQDIGHLIGAGHGLPDTAFYDRAGKLVYLKLGPYTDPAELRADVRRYALGEAEEGG